jgi:hypothetical protein
VINYHQCVERIYSWLTDKSLFILFGASTNPTDSLDVGRRKANFITFNDNKIVPDGHAQGRGHIFGIFVISRVLYELK